MTNEPRTPASCPPGCVLWLVDTDRDLEVFLKLETAHPRLTSAEAGRAASIDSLQARQHWLASRIALRAALAHFTGEEACARQPFSLAPSGRPSLPGPGPAFSLSHTDNQVLIGIAQAPSLGVDIEAVRARRISPERRSKIENLGFELGGGVALDHTSPRASDTPEDERLIAAWCRIEAYAKAVGCGVGPLLQDAGVFGRRPLAMTGEGGHSALSLAGDAIVAADVPRVALPEGYAAAVAASFTILRSVTALEPRRDALALARVRGR